jgi:hypothetical protein
MSAANNAVFSMVKGIDRKNAMLSSMKAIKIR